MSTFRLKDDQGLNPWSPFLVFCFTDFVNSLYFCFKSTIQKKKNRVRLGFVYLDMLFLFEMFKVCFGLFEPGEAV